MEEYVLYATKNILQIRKSQQDTKLDRDLQNVAKNYIIEINIFIDDENNTNDIKENIEKKDGENLDLPMADSYSHTVPIMRMYWKEVDVTDCLKSSILLYLHHSLFIADDIGSMTIRPICYNINLLESDSRSIIELRIRTGISTDITSM